MGLWPFWQPVLILYSFVIFLFLGNKDAYLLTSDVVLIMLCTVSFPELTTALNKVSYLIRIHFGVHCISEKCPLIYLRITLEL